MRVAFIASSHRLCDRRSCMQPLYLTNEQLRLATRRELHLKNNGLTHSDRAQQLRGQCANSRRPMHADQHPSMCCAARPCARLPVANLAAPLHKCASLPCQTLTVCSSSAAAPGTQRAEWIIRSGGQVNSVGVSSQGHEGFGLGATQVLRQQGSGETAELGTGTEPMHALTRSRGAPWPLQQQAPRQAYL